MKRVAVVFVLVGLGLGTWGVASHPAATGVGFVVVFGLAMAASWNRTTEGHRHHWQANGRPTVQARMAARYQGTPPGHWDTDAAVMAHYPHILAARQDLAAREAAAARAALAAVEEVLREQAAPAPTPAVVRVAVTRPALPAREAAS